MLFEDRQTDRVKVLVCCLKRRKTRKNALNLALLFYLFSIMIMSNPKLMPDQEERRISPLDFFDELERLIKNFVEKRKNRAAKGPATERVPAAKRKGENMNLKKVGKWLIPLVVVVCAAVLAGFSMHSVPAGHTGVVTRFGAVDDNGLDEGLHFVVPFVTKVIDVNNQVLKAEVASSSASRDLQTVESTVALNYRVPSKNAPSIYKNIGNDFENVVVIPAIQEAVKSVTAQYTAEELITNRQKVGDEIKETITEKIAAYGFSTESLNIVDFQFSEEFNAAIEAKQTAQQNALKAEQDLARVKIEAEQKVTQAKAEAESYRLKSQELTDELIKMEMIEKWDGQLPKVVSDSGSLFDLDTILNDSNSSSANAAE